MIRKSQEKIQPQSIVRNSPNVTGQDSILPLSVTESVTTESAATTRKHVASMEAIAAKIRATVEPISMSNVAWMDMPAEILTVRIATRGFQVPVQMMHLTTTTFGILDAIRRSPALPIKSPTDSSCTIHLETDGILPSCPSHRETILQNQSLKEDSRMVPKALLTFASRWIQHATTLTLKEECGAMRFRGKLSQWVKELVL